MTKINVISGFLGAGKTTFIKRLIGEVFQGEKLVLIENEFGEIGVDGGFLQDAGIQITEMISGCICCSLVGDFTKALEETIKTYTPDRILIEPSGVGKLSDVIAAVERIGDGVSVDTCITVVDGTKCKLYRRNFAEFYVDQIQHANCILMTRTDKASEAKIEEAVKIIREINGEANIITTHLSLLSKEQIVEAFRENTMKLPFWKKRKKPMLIIMIMTKSANAAAMSITTNITITITMKNANAAATSIITNITIMTMTRNALAVVMTTITTITMRTKHLLPGVSKPPENIPKKRSSRYLLPWMGKNTVLFYVPKVWWTGGIIGSTSTTYPVNRKYVPVLPALLAKSA